ncbi:MAG: DUF2586 domain-containing protein [Tenuifilaceae bacterium]|nr:DUF2586 domain-containing protein [Tenuifilaceae bacterium]
MGDVTTFIVDGTSGLAPGGVDGAVMVAGCCSLGTPGKAYLLGKDSDLSGLLGVGVLVDRLRDLFATGGQSPVVIAVPVAGSGGAVSAVTTQGPTGPVVTVAGTALADAAVTLAIVKGGMRNVATYKLSLDGYAWSPEKTVPTDGLIPVGSTGVTITAPATALTAGTTYSFTTTAPVASISAVLAAIEAPLGLYDVESVYITGPSGPADWAAMGAMADTLWNAHRPTYFRAEARLPGAAESLDDWVAALVAQSAQYAHRFVAVCAAFGEVSDSTGRRLKRNWGGLLAGRVMSIPVQRAAGRVRDGGISQGSLPKGFTSAMQKALEKARFATAKYYAGLAAPYWGEGRTLADVTSDYQYEEVLRTVFKAVRKARIAALKSMYDEAGDALVEGGAGGLNFLKANIEGALDTMVAALPQELAGHVVEIPPGQDIVNNGVGVKMVLIGIPIIRSIQLFASYVYAGSNFDPRLN